MLKKRPFHPNGLTLMADISEARWVEERLGQKFAHVTALLPSGFAAYARLFHPGHNPDGDLVRWADIAVWSGRTVHPLMAFECIRAPRQGYGAGHPPWRDDPTSGSLTQDDAVALAAFLTGFTDTPQSCFFAMWDGYGQFNPGVMTTLTASGSERRLVLPPPEVRAAPRLTGVGREYLLYTGPLSAIDSFFHGIWRMSPTIWWPDAREWCVSTDIDLDSTYIGASERCIEALMEDPRFEVLRTTLDAPVFMAADTTNCDRDG